MPFLSWVSNYFHDQQGTTTKNPNEENEKLDDTMKDVHLNDNRVKKEEDNAVNVQVSILVDDGDEIGKENEAIGRGHCNSECFSEEHLKVNDGSSREGNQEKNVVIKEHQQPNGYLNQIEGKNSVAIGEDTNQFDLNVRSDSRVSDRVSNDCMEDFPLECGLDKQTFLLPDRTLGSVHSTQSLSSCLKQDDQLSNDLQDGQDVSMDLDTGKVSSALDENSNMTTSSLNSIITENMLKEEEKYEEEDKVEAEKERDRVMQQMKAAPEDERFSRLKSLLDKSNVYAQFLLKQIDQQRQQEKARRELKEKAKEKRTADIAKKRENASSLDQLVPNVDVPNTRSATQIFKGSPVKTKEGKKRKRKNDGDEENDSRNAAKRQQKRMKKIKKDADNQSNEPDNEIEDHTQSARQTTRIINGDVVSDRQPVLLTGGLMRGYQIDGMEWMRGLFENGINGILADEMGLGKTIQCIALLSYFIERGMKGPYLVAAPLSTLPNWVSEFKKFTPKIKTLLYHGTKDERHAMRHKILKLRLLDEEMKIKAYPIVITSYEIVMRDRAYLNSYPWKYIIIDEGHRIKNLNCRLISELKTYRTANRLLLTGTPLQNNLAELWSLLNFLLPELFDDLNSFQEWFDFSLVSEDGGDEKLIAQEKEAHVLETLHAILTPFLLRRLKTDVDLSIPPKRELVVYAPLTAEQQEFYKSTLDKTILSKIKRKEEPAPDLEYTVTGRPKRRATKNIDYKTMLDDADSETFDFDELLEKLTEKERRQKVETEAAKSARKSTSVVSIRLQNILMQLRKCCNHPYLLEHPLDPETQEYLLDESLVKVSGKMQLLDRMLAELKKRGHKVLIFSQMTRMLDIIEDFCYLRKYQFSRIDGSMKVADRQEMIDKFNNDASVFLFLLSTRAGGLGLNLSSADTCIIYDSDWNPQVDLQAQDRCHRIGQTKPVLIFRYITANSIDEKVVERAALKRKLEKMVIHKGRFKGKHSSNKLSSEDLLELLQSKDHSHVSNIGEDFRISEECLSQLLDRSALLANSVSKTAVETPVESDLFKVVEQPQEDVLF